MKKRNGKKLFCLFMVICMILSIPSPSAKAAGKYTADWQRWTQDASRYGAMKYGCRVTAYAKMLAEAGYTEFGDPDGFFEWGRGKGYFDKNNTCEMTSPGVAPVTYVNEHGGTASKEVKDLTGNNATDANTVMDLINQGYYVVLLGRNVRYGSLHTVYIGREESIRQGKAVIFDSGDGMIEGKSFPYSGCTSYKFSSAVCFKITDKSAIHNPTGALDYAEGRTNAVWIRGWAFDPDDLSRNLDIHVYIGGPAGSGEGHGIVANTYRNDVNSVYNVGDYHGFDAEIPTSLSGNQEVYVYAINIGSGNTQLLGTKTVHISKPNDPQGCVDMIQGGVGAVTVSGWAFDLDDPSKSIEVHVYITDSQGRAEGHRIVADKYRNDVNNAYGVGDYHGYFEEIWTPLYGTNRVDVYAINTGGGGNVLLGSEVVTITCGHLFENYITNGNGTHYSICSHCGETAISECSFDKLVTEPTCMQSGYTTYICQNCRYSFETDFVGCIKHSFTNYVSDNNATAENGTKTAYCDYGCGTTDTIIVHLIGDVNGDGAVTARDKKVLYNHIAGISLLTGYEFDVGDVNGDGSITARDKKMIYNHIAGTTLLW